jgi:hypothetical protein
VSTLGGRPTTGTTAAASPAAHGTFAVYWRATGLAEWRLHSAHRTPAAAERERALLYWQYLAGWRIDQTLILQCPPGQHPAPCLTLQPLAVAPALQAHSPLRTYTKERQIARPFTSEEAR